MEHIEVVCSETNQSLGIVLPRNEFVKTDHWCRTSNIFILNSKGDVLCHQRDLHKDRFPGVWATHVGGHLAHGESYEVSAQKELEEEAGVSVAMEEIIPWRTTRVAISRLWVKEFVVLIDKDISEFTAQPGEVEKFEWKTIDEIIKDGRENPQNWIGQCPGTHDFFVEYHCMRAVLTAMHERGYVTSHKDLHVWGQFGTALPLAI